MHHCGASLQGSALNQGFHDSWAQTSYRLALAPSRHKKGNTLNRKLIDELSEQLGRLLPQAQAMSEDAREAARQALRQTLSRMDLVTRDEFDAQQRALLRAEQRIDELEAMITALESRQAD